MHGLSMEAMRHDQRLTFEQLRRETEVVIERYTSKQGQNQNTLAEEMSKTPGYISRAKKETGPLIAAMQIEILQHLTDFDIVEERNYRAVRRDR